MKPLGLKPGEKAHDLEREFDILQALPTSVPAPRAHVYCHDEHVAGSPFYLMDYVPGRIFDDCTMAEVPPDQKIHQYAAVAFAQS
jgi:aminoglycoside phosphotransferase (APT) family kinase protein